MDLRSEHETDRVDDALDVLDDIVKRSLGHHVLDDHVRELVVLEHVLLEPISL